MKLIELETVEGYLTLLNIEDISCIIERKEKAPIKSYVEIHLISDNQCSLKTYASMEAIKHTLLFPFSI